MLLAREEGSCWSSDSFSLNHAANVLTGGNFAVRAISSAR
jgi:hypothetical protein